jgi:transposase
VSAPTPRITFSWPGDWDRLQSATIAHSHRATTSSRHPGRVFEGVVTYRLGRIVECPRCGALRYAGTGPHAPHWHDGRRVDCVGAMVAR